MWLKSRSKRVVAARNRVAPCTSVASFHSTSFSAISLNEMFPTRR